MALEAILVSASLGAHLTVPSQLVESLGFHPVVDPFGRANCLIRIILAHGGGSSNVVL